MLVITELYPWHKSYILYFKRNEIYEKTNQWNKLLKELTYKWYDYGILKKIFHKDKCIKEIEDIIKENGFKI